MKKSRKNKISEICSVIYFTIMQQLKTRSYQISLLIFVCIAVIGPSVAAFLQERESSKGNFTTIETLYVVENDDCNLKFSEEELKKNKYYSKMKVIWLSATEKEKIEGLKKQMEQQLPRTLIVEILEKGKIYVDIWKPRKGELWIGEAEKIQQEIIKQFQDSIKNNLLFSKEQQEILDTKIDSRIEKIQLNGKEQEIEKTKGIERKEQSFIYGFVFLLIMLGVMAGGMIAGNVVREKNEKILEYLLISVSPVSLLLGKIAGIFILVITELVGIGLLGFCSDYFVQKKGNLKQGMISAIIPEAIKSQLTLGNVILIIIFVVLNMLLYGFLAALAGARASKVDELKDTLMPFSLCELIGGYLAMFTSIYMIKNASSIMVKIVCIFPLSSSFLLPGAILTNCISGMTIMLAMLLLIVSVILVMVFTVKSYKKNLL